MKWDFHQLRSQFPLFANVSGPFHYLDSAATSQIHQRAIDAMVRHDTFCRANVMRGNHRLAEAATEAYEQARGAVARFLNAQGSDEVVLTSGATAALNCAAHAVGETLVPGDEVVLSLAEHHSNLVPWQMLRDRKGITLRFLPLTDEGRLDVAALPAVVSERCRLIAVTHCSNVTGAMTDVEAVVAAARAVGAWVLLDGAQRVQHGPVDVQALGVDFYAFSGHKCFGPTGIGALWGRRSVLAALPPFLGGGGMVGEVTPAVTTYADPPRRFEAGTPPIAQAVGLGAAVEWMMGLPWEEIHLRERQLFERLLAGLEARPAVRMLGPRGRLDRAPIVAFDLAGHHPHDVCQVLDGRGVALRGGHHCAQPLMAHFKAEGANRASLALYNTDEDVDALLEGLDHALKVLG